MNQKLNVVLMACRQAVPDPFLLINPLEQAGLKARVIQEPCSSKVEVFQMLRTLASDADLLWIVGCPEPACQLRTLACRGGLVSSEEATNVSGVLIVTHVDLGGAVFRQDV